MCSYASGLQVVVSHAGLLLVSHGGLLLVSHAGLLLVSHGGLLLVSHGGLLLVSHGGLLMVSHGTSSGLAGQCGSMRVYAVCSTAEGYHGVIMGSSNHVMRQFRGVECTQ